LLLIIEFSKNKPYKTIQIIMGENQNELITIPKEDFNDLKEDRDSLSERSRSDYRDRDKIEFFEDHERKILEEVIREGKSEKAKAFKELLEMEGNDWLQKMLVLIAKEGKSSIVGFKEDNVVLNGKIGETHFKKDEDLDRYLESEYAETTW
jgi:hypothetical protein